MWCRKVRSLLSAYTDGELSPTDARGVREHLDHCGSCAAEYASLRRLVHVTTTIPMEEVPPFLHDRIMARLAYADVSGNQPVPARRRTAMPRGWAWAAFTVAAAAITGGLLHNRPVRDARVPLSIPSVETLPPAPTTRAPAPVATAKASVPEREVADEPVQTQPVLAAEPEGPKTEVAIDSPEKPEAQPESEPIRKSAPERVASILPGPTLERPLPVTVNTTGRPATELRATEPTSVPSGSTVVKDGLKAMPGDPVVNSTGPLPTPDSLVPIERDPTRMAGMAVEVETPGEEDEGLRAFRMFLQENSRTVPQPPTFNPREQRRKSL